MKTRNAKIVVLILSIIGHIGGLGGFIWLFITDWKLAIAIFFIIWGNNLATKGGAV